jgi:hypothetical protein
MASGSEVPKWLEAARLEVEALIDKRAWVEDDIANAKGRILPGIWVFRRKRSPDGTIKKWKGRFTIRGDLQDDTGAETFAPVVAWSSVRFFLILSLTLSWITCSIDFSNAFIQATLPEPIWVHLPRGFHSDRPGKTCLKLEKSVYGISIAPRLWYQHLLAALLKLGLTQSAHDPCLLYKKDLMVICYVDDLGLAAPTMDIIDLFVASLESLGFELTRESTFGEFLGIKMEHDKTNGTIHMTQRGLINKIINTVGLSECNPTCTPTTATALGADPDGPSMTESWSYPSVVGMLLYLSTNTRPDITFAVSQVARFNSNPKKSHAKAIKMIVRYLKGTKTQGTIVKATGTLDIAMWADADFAGLHGAEAPTDRNCARSRTGWIICLGNCPLLWKSQLQGPIALSTLEAEYVALSDGLRTVVWLKALVIEVTTALGLPESVTATIHAVAYEDNQGAFLLATKHKISPRTKYFSVKYHWFHSLYDDGVFGIGQCTTNNQDADYLTKGLMKILFQGNRKRRQGW